MNYNETERCVELYGYVLKAFEMMLTKDPYCLDVLKPRIICFFPELDLPESDFIFLD